MAVFAMTLSAADENKPSARASSTRNHPDDHTTGQAHAVRIQEQALGK